MKPKVGEKVVQEMIKELWENATFSKESLDIVGSLANTENKRKLVREFPLKEAFEELSTIRNRHLITVREQKKLRKTVVAVFGMSVGSHVATAWMLESKAEIIKIVDLDTVATSNLNRLSFGLQDIGKKKVDVVKARLKRINPFSEVLTYDKGSNDEMQKVFESYPKIDVLVDEIDDIKAKVFLRKLAKKYRLPLFQAADVGDNTILDIERYDVSPQPDIFLGRIPSVEDIDIDDLSSKERIRLIVELLELEEHSESMLDSLLSIGDTLATWPQLGATATISGGIVATAIKKVILGEKVRSGRYYFSLDSTLVSRFNSPRRKKARRKRKSALKRKLGFK